MLRPTPTNHRRRVTRLPWQPIQCRMVTWSGVRATIYSRIRPMFGTSIQPSEATTGVLRSAIKLRIMKFLAAAICVLAVGASAQVGPSGIVSPDGVNTQFSHDFANDIVLIGPSGIVTKSGANRQLTHGEATLHVGTPAAPAPLPVSQYVHQRGVIGHSGIVRPDGINVQFTHDQANNIVLVGPSGIVTKDGSNIQLTDDLQFAHRFKRAAEHVIGASGIITSSGQLIQLEPGVSVVHAGPSGIVLSNGRNIQLL